MAIETFSFSYTVFTVDATLDDVRLVVKTGMRTVVAPIAQLQHLHVTAARGADHAELLLSHLLPSGKLKRSRVHADRNQPGFDALVAAILLRRPEIDIREATPDDAYRQTGAKPMTATALTAVMSVGWIIVALMLSPLVMHGLDRGAATAPVSALNTPLGSRNLTVTGRVLLAHAHHAPSETDTRLGGTSAWLPLVPADWTPDQPVTAVLEVRGIKPEALLGLAEQTEFVGVLRDIFWEGPSVTVRAGLVAQGVAVAPTLKLVQYRGDTRHDLAIITGVLGFLGLLIAGVWFRLRGR